MSQINPDATATRTRPSPIRGRDVLYVTAAIVVLASLGTGLILAGLIFFGVDEFERGKPSFTVLLISTLVQVAVILSAIHFVLHRRRGVAWRHLGVVALPARTILLGVAGGVLLAGLMELIERIFGISLGSLVTDLIAPQGFTWPAYLAVLLLIGITTPLAEEFLFRGVIYTWMRTRWRPSVAITLNAVLFGLIHVYYPPAYIVLVGLLGAIFAFAYERSGTVWLPIALHAGHNSAVVTAIYWTLAV